MYFCCRVARVSVSRAKSYRAADRYNGSGRSSHAKIHMGYGAHVYSFITALLNIPRSAFYLLYF